MNVFSRNGWTINCIVVGELMVNCYFIGRAETSDLIVVDPGEDALEILSFAQELGGTIRLIVNTHGHGDHIGGNSALAKATGAPIAIGAKDAEMLGDPWKNLSAPFGFNVTSPPASKLLNDGDELELGSGRLKVVGTPGHSPGGITLVGDGFAIVGDLIFDGSVGRTDFPGGDMGTLLKSIDRSILTLPDPMVLLSGHGDVTTVGVERASNPFLTGRFR